MVKIAIRDVRRQPLLYGAVIAVLAFATATTCALFSLVDGLLFRPLPFHDAGRLVAIGYPRDGGRPVSLEYAPELADRREALRLAIERSPLLSARTHAGFSTFFRPDHAAQAGVRATGVDARFFELFRLRPVAGAVFTVDDERSPAAVSRDASAPLPIIVGHALAARLFGTAEAALGMRDLAGRRVRIVAVMPDGVKFPEETNVWAPVPSDRPFLPAYAKLADGATREQLAQAFPDLRIVSLRDAVRPNGEEVIVAFFVAAALLLVLTWVQVSALIMSRTLSQVRDVGVCLALGAKRWQLLLQPVVQGAIIAVTASGIALGMVRPLTHLLIERMPEALRRGQYLDPDGRVVLFGGVAAFLSVAVVSIVPGLFALRVSPVVLLRSRLGESSPGPGWWRRLVLVVQMSVTALVLYLGGLTVHSFIRVVTLDYGFDAGRVLLFTPPPWAGGAASAREYRTLFDRHTQRIAATIEALQSLPGVSATGLFSGPLDAGISRADAVPVTAFGGVPRDDVRVRSNVVGPEFVTTLGARVLAGGTFTDPEHAGQDGLLLINQTLARQLVSDRSSAGPPVWMTVVGRELRTPIGGGRIVGVIRDLVQTGPAVPVIPEIYRVERRARAVAVIAIRVPSGGEPVIRTALETVWGRISPAQTRWMRDRLDAVLTPYRDQTVVMSTLALSCVLVAGIGLFGGLSYTVRAGTRETAIRMALGADPRTVAWTVVRGSLLPVAVGLVVGTAMGIAAASVIGHELVQIETVDAATTAGVAAGLILLAVIAAAVPARQASQVDPVAVLRDVSSA